MLLCARGVIYTQEIIKPPVYTIKFIIFIFFILFIIITMGLSSPQVLAITLILVLLLILISPVPSVETFVINNNKPTFLSRKQTRDFITKDRDGYLSSLSSSDLFSRGYANNISAYISNSANASTPFTNREKRALTDLTREADSYIYDSDNPESPVSPVSAIIGAHNAQRLAQIPWKFAKTQDNVYEGGTPHTREDIIFLPSNIFTNETPTMHLLIHEKMHIFTRFYKKETQEILHHHGFTLISNSPFNETNMHRSNPDTNRDIYFNPSMGKIFISNFYNTTPHHLHDISSPLSDEHPYEWIAYKVSTNHS